MHLIKRLVLASQSPRRINLLRQIALSAEVIPSTIPEIFDTTASAEANARSLAYRKAAEVAATIEDGIVVGADTIVVVDGLLLGKPARREEAFEMLKLLSGRTHTVLTAFCLFDRPSNQSVTEIESTRVTFRKLPRQEIEEYVAGGSPMDKAGAYGIQDDYGAVFVTRIEGCFYNVVGFPLAHFYTTLDRFQTMLENL